MQSPDSKIYNTFPATSFAAAAAGAAGSVPPPAAAAAGPASKGAAQAEAPATNGTGAAAGFAAIKRSFEGAAANGTTASGAPGPLLSTSAETANGSAFPVVGQAGFAMPNGLYTSAFGGGPSFPQQPTPSGMAVPAQNGTGPSPNGTTFSAATSPFLAGAALGTNGAAPPTLPFGSPVPSSAGPYSGSAFDPTPTSPNPYGGPPLPGQAGPGPYGQGAPPPPGAGFGGLGAATPYMMSPMLGVASPQLSGANGFGMPYPIGGAPQNGFNGMNAAPTSTQTRTVYVGNLPSDASVDELLSQVRFGPIENVRILPEKSCAFISFLEPNTAAAFHSDALMRKIRLHDNDLKIGWGKPSAVSANVLAAVQQSDATRNVYIGNLDETVTEQTLRDDLARFGPIDQVKIVRDKNIGFVHFLSIATAIKVVQTLPTEKDYAGRRVAYGKDRTAYVPKNQHQQQQHNMAAAAMGSMAAQYGGFGGLGFGGNPQMGFGQNNDPNAQPGNRTIYLGNIHPEVTTEEICNIIRGGILQQIRYIPDKHICFVTFVDPHCALAFYQTASFQGIALHNRRLKVGWGKQSGPTSPGIAMVVQSGGSRNVYVGSIEDFETYSDEKLRTDFGEYGEIELINFLKEKQCAFVNFTNITNAIKAIEGIKQHPDYQNLKISYGKDRCGGAPRAFRGSDIRNQQRSHQHQQQRQQGADSTNAGSGAPANGFPRSPFTADSMSFPASPMQADKLQIAEGLSTPLPEIGALELDEDAAAAATGKSD
ncbi:hypothetical protein JCM8115_003674 [Rhodotorula mucilaginosa]|uniref:RRM domain-containing protein n=2 Tax=cellular organisms TaxID=131567 RepID=A0A9P6W2B6_RHOMI|nr:hypothetical protein C6P46_003831 [Rhodotorula mucilaginosa]